MKLTIAFATAITALGLAFAAPAPEAKAGGVYWNNNGGGAVVINGGGRYYGPRPYYYGPAYRGRGYVYGPNGACARGYYGRGGCVRY